MILVLFLKFFNPFLEKSTRHFKTKKKHLSFFDGVYIASMNQFHKEDVVLTTKSNESKSVFLIEQASSPYNKIGTHLVSSRCKTTSSVAILPIFPNIALAARQKERLECSVEILKRFELTR